MAGRDRSVAALEIRDRLLSRLDAIQKVANVGLKLVLYFLITIALHRGGAISQAAGGSRLAWTRELRDLILWRNLDIGEDFEATPIDQESSPGTAHFKTVSGTGPHAANLPAGPVGKEPRVFKYGLKQVRRLTNSCEGIPSSHGGNTLGNRVRGPLYDVQIVREQVSGLAAGVIPKPAEMINAPMLVERHIGRRPKPHIPVFIVQRLGSHGTGETWHDVSESGDAGIANVSNVAPTNQLNSLLVVLARALLRSNLDHAVMILGDFDHPTPFPHDVGERLFHIHILARRACQDRQQCVPMIGSRNDNGIDAFPLQHLAEIFEAFGATPAGCYALAQPGFIDFTNGGNLNVGLRHEIEQMSFADQADSNQADSNPVIGSLHVLV